MCLHKIKVGNYSSSRQDLPSGVLKTNNFMRCHLGLGTAHQRGKHFRGDLSHPGKDLGLPLEARSGAFAEVKLKFVLKIVKTPSVLRGELMQSVFSTLPWRPEMVLLLR